jgi:hypothetical protein
MSLVVKTVVHCVTIIEKLSRREAMIKTIQEILDACPTHGFGTLQGHSSLCPNPEHRALAQLLLDEADECQCENCSTDDEECPLRSRANCSACDDNEDYLTKVHELQDKDVLLQELLPAANWMADLIPLPHQDPNVLLNQCIEGGKWMRDKLLNRIMEDDIPF